MDNVICKEVIITTLSRKGNGKTTPIRVVTEFWDKEGNLLAESDSQWKLHEIRKILEDFKIADTVSYAEALLKVKEMVNE